MIVPSFHTAYLTNMENSSWTMDSQISTSELLDYDLYPGFEHSNQLLTPPVRSALVTFLATAHLVALLTLGISRQLSGP